MADDKSSAEPLYQKLQFSKIFIPFEPREPYSYQDMRRDVEEHHANLVKAIEKYGARRAAMRPAEIKQAVAGLSPRHAQYLGYMNPYARVVWQRIIADAVQKSGIDPYQFDMTTIVDKRWCFGDDKWDCDIKEIIREVEGRCRGLNYLFMVEFAPYRNEYMHGARLIAPHIQGFTWGHVSRREMDKIKKSFRGGLFGAVPIKRTSVYSFPGALRYSIKPPYHPYSVIARSGGTLGHCRSRKMWLTQHFFLYQHLGEYRYPDLTFTGGEGAQILSAATWPT